MGDNHNQSLKQILIEPQNPLDLRPEDLGDLVQAISELDSDYEVALAFYDNEATGVTFWEVLHIWVPWTAIGGSVASQIITLSAAWLRKRFEKYPTRPKSVKIWGPNGKALKTIVIKQADQEPEEELPGTSTRNRPPIR